MYVVVSWDGQGEQQVEYMVVRADGDYNVNSSYSCYMQGHQFLCHTKREEQEEVSVTLPIPEWKRGGICLFVSCFLIGFFFFVFLNLPFYFTQSSVSRAYFALIKERHRLTKSTLFYCSPVYMVAIKR